MNISELRQHFGAENVEVSDLGGSGGSWIAVHRRYPPIDRSRMTARAELKSGLVFASGAFVSIAVPDDASRVAGLRIRSDKPADFVWSRNQWMRLDVSFLAAVEALLTRRFEHVCARNERVRAKIEEASAIGIAQQARRAQIEEALPTHAVDAWIFANTKYTPETFAALGRATKRDRRREARKAMASA